jgi:hypothetical protein
VFGAQLNNKENQLKEKQRVEMVAIYSFLCVAAMDHGLLTIESNEQIYPIPP